MINKLSNEILLKIIDYTDSRQTIGQCRAVCKHWNHLAEPLMYSKKIVIKNEREAFFLYNNLYMKPGNGKHIKNLNFATDNIPDLLLDYMVQLSFTSNMEYLTGQIGTNNLYTVLNRIIGEQPEKFKKLKVIPYPSRSEYNSDVDATLVSTIKMLQDVLLAFDERHSDNPQVHLVKNFNEFKNLKSFRFYGKFSNIAHLEDTLKGHSDLECLEMNLLIQDTEHAWSSKNVEKAQSVKNIHVAFEYHHGLLDYLSLKYPNAEHINIRVLDETAISTTDMFLDILNAVNKIPRCHIHCKISNQVFHESAGYIRDNRLNILFFKNDTVVLMRSSLPIL